MTTQVSQIVKSQNLGEYHDDAKPEERPVELKRVTSSHNVRILAHCPTPCQGDPHAR